MLVMWSRRNHSVSYIFGRRLHMKFKWNRHINFIGESLGKCLQTADMWPLVKVTKWPWPLEFHRGWSLMHYCITEHNSNQNCTFQLFPFKSPRNQIWPYHKIGQGQDTGSSTRMLHTKFQGNWLSGSGEDAFLRFLPYMGMAAILIVIYTKYIKKILSLFARRLHMKFK